MRPSPAKRLEEQLQRDVLQLCLWPLSRAPGAFSSVHGSLQPGSHTGSDCAVCSSVLRSELLRSAEPKAAQQGCMLLPEQHCRVMH